MTKKSIWEITNALVYTHRKILWAEIVIADLWRFLSETRSYIPRWNWTKSTIKSYDQCKIKNPTGTYGGSMCSSRLQKKAFMRKIMLFFLKIQHFFQLKIKKEFYWNFLCRITALSAGQFWPTLSAVIRQRAKKIFEIWFS